MNNYLPTDYQSFIHTSRYARWLEDEGRRESWGETVQRYIENVVSKLPEVDTETVHEISQSILGLEVMPSMRAMMTAGPAATRDNTCMYNCSYLPVDDPKSFDEAMFILLCGTGVGFSVERQFVSNSLRSLSCSLVRLLSLSKTVRKVGLKLFVKFLLSSGLVKSLNGILV